MLSLWAYIQTNRGTLLAHPVNFESWFGISSAFLVICQLDILKIKLLRISKTSLDLECSSPAFNKTCVLQECRTTKTESKHFQWPKRFCRARVSRTLEHSRSNLVFEQSRRAIILFSETSIYSSSHSSENFPEIILGKFQTDFEKFLRESPDKFSALRRAFGFVFAPTRSSTS